MSEAMASMEDQELIERACKGFCLHAAQYIREVGQHADPETFKAVLGNSLFLLRKAAQGNFYGKIEVLFKGPEIKQVEITRETFSMGQEFHRVFEGLAPVDPFVIRVGRDVITGDGNQRVGYMIKEEGSGPGEKEEEE